MTVRGGGITFAIVLGAAALAACGFPRPPDLPECTSASDCTSAAAPFCIAGSCVAACQASTDCQGFAGMPFCQTASGKCVACLDASACSADESVCDATDGACRGCARDEECPGGICVEADGTCVANAEVIFVAGFGVNSGPCTKEAPCSLPFGVSQATANRNHIKILNGTVHLSATLMLTPDLYIEGTDTVVTGPPGIFSIAQFVTVTLSHMTIQPTSGLAITVDAARSLRLQDVHMSGGINVNGGTLDVDLGTFTGGVSCMGGTATVRRSFFDHSPMNGTTCQLIMRRNHFDMTGDAGFGADGGALTFENNLITQSEGVADSMTVNNLTSASTIRFNTWVNTTAAPSDGVALSCNSPLQVSSNVFAYESMHPVAYGQGCEVRYSLFDSVALPEATMGVGRKAGDSATFFVDKAGKDYHLAAHSPALGAAEPGVGVTDDFDGKARPAPAGSVPDMGAFEAP